MEKPGRQALLSWLLAGLLVLLCGSLALLQYGWIGEVSRAERERLQQGLQANLYRLSRDFNDELNAACAALLPNPVQIEQSSVEEAYAARYRQWKASGGRDRLFRRVAIAKPDRGALALHELAPQAGIFRTADWPEEWAALRERLQARFFHSGPPGPMTGGFARDTLNIIDVPRFGPPREGPGPPRFGGSEQDWLLLELDLDYVRSVLLPELLQQHLGAAGRLDYEAEVLTNTNPPFVIYQPDTRAFSRLRGREDATVSLFEVRYEQFSRRPPPGPGMRPPDKTAAGLSDSGRGRWQLSVRHSAGSLETLVAQARRRNLAVSGSILLMMAAAAGALFHFTRQARRLAQLQMDFVAGVSHELRTPLTVIGTAAYNLRSQVARNPEHVERYGALIQKEAEKLTGIVEQVLQFASIQAGSVMRERKPLSVEALVQDALQSSKGFLEGSGCLVEKRLDSPLPAVLGDALALKQALQNLLHNAVHHGAKSGNWIGVFASVSRERNGDAVEIRVADRGPGIPADEQRRIFDPFFRGQRALRDQIRGTGLGLNLVKQIVEAHGGTITLRSEPMKGAEFILRIPAVSKEQAE